MKIKSIASFLALATLVAFGCKKKGGAGYSNVKLDTVFELKYNHSAKVQEEDLNLTFAAAPEDSRCPKHANCIREGEVKVQLTVVREGDMAQQVEFVRAPSDKNPTIRKLGGIQFQLLDVSPYPEAGKKIKPENYVLRLAVRKQ